jgi:hypothetical protein
MRQLTIWLTRHLRERPTSQSMLHPLTHPLVRAKIRRHPSLLAVPLSAALIAAMVAIDRFVFHAVTTPWTYWKDGLTLLISLHALARTLFPGSSITLLWMDRDRVPEQDVDGSCAFNFRLSLEGPTLVNIDVSLEPRYAVTSLADGLPAPSRAVRLAHTATIVGAGVQDIQVRLSADREAAFFCEGELALQIGLHIAGEPFRSVATAVPISQVIGGGGASC